MIETIIKSKAFHGALSGAIAAAVVDFHAFMAFKSGNDFITYHWGLALFRWLQGAVAGALVGSGYGALVD